MHRRILSAIAALAALIVVSVALAAGPASTSAPKIVGTAAFSKTITCDPGTFSPSPASIAYTWTRSGGEIANATTSKLTIDDPSLMGGYDIACSVTATDATGAATTVSSPAVRPALGPTTISITSVTVKKKGAFVIKGQIGPKELVTGVIGKTKAIAGSEIVLHRLAPAQGPKAEYQLSSGSNTVDRKGRFTVTGHDKAGKRKIIVDWYCGHNCFGIWAPVSTTRTIKVSSGFTGTGGTNVSITR